MPLVVDGFALGSRPRAIQIVWFSLLIVAQAGLALLLLTYYLSKSAQPRIPSLYNVVFLSFLESIVYVILFYTGQYMNTDPPYIQCFLQAVLKHGLDPAFIVSSLLLVSETWLNTLQGPKKSSRPIIRQVTLLALPYFNALLFAIPAAVLGLRFREKVVRGPHSFFS
ncbi:hypothetical protein SISNIDRAFT_254018 [Sistotremastrum niveocremeum HHB9708]|uniref:Uncharacterized protein n=1 Tax=Sistotremastrum niveocremeum HHB9708 TaxID=1314777 RepID=A0A164PJE7_9AGAM|nr:hypothetical protein SISNIDRAFT_254018 [Sistotremastrum niveocremeum HHB9708]